MIYATKRSMKWIGMIVIHANNNKNIIRKLIIEKNLHLKSLKLIEMKRTYCLLLLKMSNLQLALKNFVQQVQH